MHYATLSVITPTLNSAEYISSCITNVVEQSAIVEHLIVDGGSTDGTQELVKFHSKKYKHLRLIEGSYNQSEAVNVGVEKARGKYIGILNVDDRYVMGAINKAVNLLEKNHSDFIYGNCSVVDNNNSLIYKNKPAGLSYDKLVLGLILRNGLFTHPVNPSAYFYTKKLHQSVGGLDTTDNYSMDVDFLIKVFKKSKTEYINEDLGIFVLHKNTKTMRSIKNMSQEDNIKQVLKNHFKNNRSLLETLFKIKQRLY